MVRRRFDALRRAGGMDLFLLIRTQDYMMCYVGARLDRPTICVGFTKRSAISSQVSVTAI